MHLVAYNAPQTLSLIGRGGTRRKWEESKQMTRGERVERGE